MFKIKKNLIAEAMEQLANRLEGPFNIESVLEPLDVTLSEAVMTLQDNGDDVIEKVSCRSDVTI